MPGFNEFSKHDSEFNKAISSKEVFKRDIKNRAHGYLTSLGIVSTWCVTYSVRGTKLTFYYWSVSEVRGTRVLVKRVVYLSDWSFIESRASTFKKVVLYYNEDLGNFVIA